jgi:D-alanine-D-alanine ligase-like ATP-grasp enzyme
MLLKNAGIEYSFSYNGEKGLGIKSGNKVVFHELLQDKEYVPKTTFTIEGTDNLKFPVVGKPASGHSGLGIVKFDTKEDLLKSSDHFDLFSEAIDIEREFRCMFVNNKLYMIIERIPNIEKNKNISNKRADEEVEFVYIQLNEMVNDFLKVIPLEFFAFDIALDKSGKIMLIESNMGIGLAANSLCRTYTAIYRDFFKKDPPVNKQMISDKLADVYNNEIKNKFKEEYSKSLCPL